MRLGRPEARLPPEGGPGAPARRREGGGEAGQSLEERRGVADERGAGFAAASGGVEAVKAAGGAATAAADSTSVDVVTLEASVERVLEEASSRTNESGAVQSTGTIDGPLPAASEPAAAEMVAGPTAEAVPEETSWML